MRLIIASLLPPLRSLQRGFGLLPGLRVAAVLVIAAVITLCAIVVDDKSPSLWVSIVKNSLPLMFLTALIGIPLACAWAWDWFVEYRTWNLGPTSALHELRKWYLAPPERRPPGGPLAMLSALDDPRINAAVEGETALHWVLNIAFQGAVGKDLEPVVEWLLAAGANPNARDQNQTTPLHAAVESQAPRAIVKRLLAAGADPNASNSMGSTPLTTAQGYWDKDNAREITAMLESAARRPKDPSESTERLKEPHMPQTAPRPETF